MNKINSIITNGDNNIIIQDINGSHIYTNSDEGVKKMLAGHSEQIKEILEILKNKQEPVLRQFAEKIYNIGYVKNMVVSGGKIDVKKAENVTINQAPKSIQKFLTNPITISSKFWGREDTLRQLAQKLNTEKQVALVGVKGIGGIGKTYIAAEFVHRYKEQYDYIVWLDYSDNLSNVLTSPLLMQNLEVEFQEKLEDTLAIIKNRLENLKGKKLFVLDNVTNIRDFYPDIDLLPLNSWQILCTTRSNDIEDFENIEIGVLPLHEARMLFCEHYLNIKVKNISAEEAYSKLNTDETQNLDDLLKNRIDFHTLTITLLAKTANSAKMTIADLNNTMKDENLDTQVFEEDLYAQYDRQQRKMFAILLKAFSLANINKKQLELLKHYSLFPSSPIEFQNLGELLSDTFPALGNLINELTEKGWLEKIENIEGVLKQFYRMHQILQEMVLLQQIVTFNELIPLVGRLNNLLDTDLNRIHPNEKFKWVIFGDSLLNKFNKLPKLAQSIETLPISKLQNSLALVHRELGSYTKAKELLQKTVTVHEKHLGDKHQTTAVSYHNLALTLQNLGDYEGAIDYFQKAIKIDEKQYGQTHPRTALSYICLATVLRDLGDYLGAKELLQKAIINHEKNLGKDHPNTVTSYSNLALVHRELGEYLQAKKLFHKVLMLNIKNFGKEHPETADSYNNLATVNRALGDYVGARELFQKAINYYEKYFGKEHPKTAISYSGYAMMLQSIGDYTNAKNFFQKALKSDEKNYGPEHPNTARSYSNLATVLEDLRDYTGAKELLEKAVIANEKNLGPAHPNTATNYSNLALILQDLGDYAKAKELLLKAIIADDKNYGPEHPNKAISYSNLALVLQDLGDYTGARELFLKSIFINEKNFGDNHPNTATGYNNLAWLYIKLNEFEKAIELWEKCYPILSNYLGDYHPNTQIVTMALKKYKKKKHNIIRRFFNLFDIYHLK